MNNNTNEKQKYSWSTCLVFAIFGFGFLIGFLYEAYFFFTGSRPITIALLASGFLAYVFIYTAYKGKPPKWFNDEDIFSSKK